MKVEEAKEITKKRNVTWKGKDKRLYRRINRKIKSSASDGYGSIVIYNWTSPVIAKLENDGYKLTFHIPSPSTRFFTVNWTD